VRKQHPVFGVGTFDVISSDNPSVLAYIRTLPAGAGAEEGTRGSDTVLCVCNLSRLAQPAELPLQQWEGKIPIELMGRVPFPRIGELPYFVTLAPYGFYWFELVDPPGGG
jgi:maltose alpha-D-glucosyltransferase/alpha-amylase